jgi:hypothetical protein
MCPNSKARVNQIAAAPWVLRVAASTFQGKRALWVWKWPRSQIFFSLELKKSFHWAHVPQFKGARESNCCSSVSFASCGDQISGKEGLVGLKMTPQPNIFFFRVKKKLSLSTCAPIQRRAWIKLLQLREFCELRRLHFREGGPCGSENDPAAKYFFL